MKPDLKYKDYEVIVSKLSGQVRRYKAAAARARRIINHRYYEGALEMGADVLASLKLRK